MASLYTQSSKNIRKSWTLMFGFLIVVIGLGWFFSWYFEDSMILYIVAGIAMFQALASYWWSDKIVLKMAGAKEISRDSHRELWNIVENLCITAGLPVPKIYVINDPVPNAFATGRNPKHAAVAFTTGLVAMLDRSELEGVAAHELSHIGNRDMLVMTMAVILVGFLSLLSDLFLRMHWFGGGRDNDSKGGGQAQAIIMVVGIVLLILSPLIGTLIQLAVSRKREFLADASGALLTRYPEGLASALQKIENYSHNPENGGEMKRASQAMAHMYISNPFGAKARRGLKKMFMTHPTTEDRIRALMSGNQ